MKVIRQNILEVSGPAIICHQVNTLGVMGAGLALQIKKKWPVVYERYVINTPKLGRCLLISGLPGNISVANLAGQMGTGRSVRQTNYGALASALHRLHAWEFLGNATVYFPHGTGCGLAGGDWSVVSELIEFYFPDGVICKL